MPSAMNTARATIFCTLIALVCVACETGIGTTDTTTVCESAEACVDAVTDLDCVGEWTCAQSACAYVCVIGSPCEGDEMCGYGQTCIEEQCGSSPIDEPDPACTSDEECQKLGPNSLCIEGTCSDEDPPPAECVDDDECEGALICDQGACVEPLGCNDPLAGCPAGTVCVEGVCVEEEPTSTCIATGCSGEICSDEPKESGCAEQAWTACLKLTDCGNHGANGACGWELNDDYLTCLEEFGKELPTCGPDKPCDEGFKCVEGNCIEKDPPPAQCGPNKPCDVGFKCVEGNCVQTDVPPTSCVVTGCKKELCAAQEQGSLCIDEDWHVCLELTTCGNFGPAATCDWKMTDAYWLCLKGFETPACDLCDSDLDCGEGFACECTTGSGCPTGDAICVWQCVEQDTTEPAECVSDDMCTGGLLCSVTYGDCLSNPECGAGGPCTDECWGYCVEEAAQECFSNWDCPEGQYCDFGWNAPNGVPIAQAGVCADTDPCMVTGCFDHICADEPVEGPCDDGDWSEKYGCYSLAKCGTFGEGGTCGWQETEEFLTCVETSG